MKLQSIQLPRTGICTEEKMYFRRGGAIDFAWDKDYIVMSHDSTILFDTYFNGCSAEKWFKYTKIKKISINLHVRGKFRITLMRKEKSLDGSITKFLSEQTFGEPDVEGEYSFPFESESNSGMFCFQILCLSDGSIFYDGFYDGEVSDNDISYVKIALDICTFKREIFVKKNIQALNSHIMCNEASPMMGHLEIFISDNAGTLKDEEVILNDKIHMVKNKNTGGAGGFTRGMIEASKLKKSHNLTHILVMDDDVIINPIPYTVLLSFYHFLKKNIRIHLSAAQCSVLTSSIYKPKTAQGGTKVTLYRTNLVLTCLTLMPAFTTNLRKKRNLTLGGTVRSRWTS